jgi:hypothetical protein
VAWQTNGTTYWLTQTVTTGRNAHFFNFTMLSAAGNKNIQWMDLVEEADQFIKDADTVSSSDSAKDDHGLGLGELGDYRTDQEGAFRAPSIVGIGAEKFLSSVDEPDIINPCFRSRLPEGDMRCSAPRRRTQCDLSESASRYETYYPAELRRLCAHL